MKFCLSRQENWKVQSQNPFLDFELEAITMHDSKFHLPNFLYYGIVLFGGKQPPEQRERGQPRRGWVFKQAKRRLHLAPLIPFSLNSIIAALLRVFDVGDYRVICG